MNEALPEIGIDSIPGMVILAHPDGTIKYASQQFFETTGFTSEDIKGNSLTSLWESPHETLPDILKQLEKKAAWQKEIRHLKKDGSYFQEACSISKIPADNGESFYLLKVGHAVEADASKLQETIRQLEKSENSYRNVVESSPIAIALTRVSDARYVDVNEAWARRTGFKKEEVLGRKSTDLKVYRDLNVRKKMWEEFNKKGYVDDLELAFTNRFGENLCSLVSARRIEFDGEECLLYISTKIDDLKATQKALAESEENYRTILDTAPYSITVSKKADGTYLQVNKAFTQKSGYAVEELLGRTPIDINIYANPSDRDRLIKILDKEKHVSMLEIPFRSKDGTISDNMVSMSTFQYQGEDCIISIGVDITERKKVEEELANYRKNLEEMVAERTRKLEAAQKKLLEKEKLAVLGQLTATVSHELRNPLGVIRSSNFFLQRRIKEKDEKTNKHFRRIDEQITHCDAIVGELLEYTQRPNVDKANRDMAPWITEVVEQIREQSNIGIKLDMDQNLPSIPHDPERMRRVLINLLNNAVHAVNAKVEDHKKERKKYLPEISVHISVEEQSLFLSVHDNGIGMDAETRQKAFEPLFTTKARGTGIGLSIVKKIVEDHGGTLQFESRPDEGTKVTAILGCDPKEAE